MKMILAIVQPAKLEQVKVALNEKGIAGLTVLDCQGYGKQKGHTEVYRGHEYTVNLLRKVMVMAAVNDDLVELAVEAIQSGGRTGKDGAIGDGKIFVMDLDDAIRIRTGQHGTDAL
jgi:nitrogen regulatory protein P-II 2